MSLLKVSAHMCRGCRRSPNTGAAGVEGILFIVRSTEKSRFHVLTFLLDSWGLGFLFFLLSNVVRSEIDSVTGLSVHVGRRSPSVRTRPSHVSSQRGVRSAWFSLFPRTRDILKAFHAAVTAIRPPARNQKNPASREKEIPGTETTTIASNSFA